MPDEKHLYEALPIPTYSEAIGESSQGSTPLTPRSDSSNEPAHPAEREGLLGHDPGARIPVPTRRAGYRPPPTEDGISNRGSMERDTFLNQRGERESEDDDEVRREMEEMEIQDPHTSQSSWGKRISSLSASLTSRLPWIRRIGWPKIDANFCIIIGRIFAILLVMAVVYLLFMSDLFSNAANRIGGQMFPAESVRIFVQESASEERIVRWMNRITETDHLAGTEGDYILAEIVQELMVKNNLEDVKMDEYGVYLNYPKEGGRKIELLGEDEKPVWQAKIDEPQLYTNPPRQQTPVFHGHSKAGDVTGPLIYCNYGSRADYKRFYDSGMDTRGAIALVRYYGTQGDRALKVKAAEAWGFKAVIMYSDPADDGFTLGDTAPNGRYMPKDGVQRGAVSLMSWVVGDVLTPGWASVKGAKRVSKENNPGLPNIPSIPISWGDAQKLLQSIQGFGLESPPEWTGAVPDVKYWTGNLSTPKVHLVNEQDEVEQQPIWNVLGKITGIEQKEKSIIVGNHRDAWVFGATDPGSGTAVFLEVMHIFGDLVSRGWRPQRTIEFASWDGEEYNLIGSTEHVEKNMEKLRKDAFVYLNVDVGVGGNKFRAAGSPIFKKALLRVLDRTTDPYRNATLRQLWDERGAQLDGLGAGSDYVAFQDMAGTSSLDFGFEGPVYPYHSAYDNFEWMASQGDPDFRYHKLLAQVWALLILEFCDRAVLPFDIRAYSASVTKWVMDLENWADSKGPNQAGSIPWTTEPLREAALQFAQDSRRFEKFELEWDGLVLASGGFESPGLASHRKSHNTRMANFETHLLDLEEGGGIPNRTQFKHVIFGPQLWSGYEEAYFPAIRDAVEVGDWGLAKKMLEKAANIIKRASSKMADGK
ncbi:hypothetical protein EYC80_010552 [Monilinia laxa]|uniref:Transferrin receptor-like dimerisation domain-containing protein n=2 Tax=Monilinia TaxID=38447 RepID=A0A5N6JPA0_MONLA|nr:hypothetical protein EYC80_010552 [Monilinia laxa]